MYTSPLLFYIQLSFIYSVTIAMRQEQGLSNKPSAYDVTDMATLTVCFQQQRNREPQLTSPSIYSK